MIKRLLILLFIHILLLTSCRNENIQEQKKEENNSSTDEISILSYYESTEHRKMLNYIVDDFLKENTNITIKIEFIPYENYMKRLLMQHSQGVLPDILIVENSNMPVLINLDILEDITSYVEQNDYVKNYHKTLVPNIKDNNRYYGLPFTFSFYALYCNMTILEKYGAEPPKDWDELKSVSKKITSAGVDSFGICGKQTEQGTSQFLQLLLSTGSNINSLNRKESIEVFKLLEYMIRDNTLAKNCVNWSENDLRKKFSRGTVAMMINTSTQLPILTNEEIDFEWEVFPVPIYTNDNSVVCGENIGITKGRANQNVFSFLSFISNYDMTKKIALQYGGVPVRVDVTDELKRENQGIGDVFYNRIDFAVTKGPYKSWLDISNFINYELFELLTLSKTPEEVAKELQTAIKEYLIWG